MIPKSFQIMGHTVKVSITENLDEGDNGRYQPDLNEIRIRPVGPLFDASTQEQTFWHEATHCIFSVLSYDSHYKNERLVDRIGQCLYQIDKTRKGNA